jgi:hypothetical protein
VPSRVMMRNWRVERLKESGRMPARKELSTSEFSRVHCNGWRHTQQP